MNTIIVAVAVLALASCSTAGDEKQIKEVRVTNQTIATQPAGAPYVIDLTRSGTTYDVAAGIDSSRVRVRTSSKEEMTLTEFVSRQKGNYAGQRLLLGSLNDLIVVLPPNGADGGVSEAQCDKDPQGGGSCSCSGRKDCSDLSKSGKCKSGPTDAYCGSGVTGSGFGCICSMK